MNKPIVGITMGDPAGSGPEITIKALADPEQYTYCRPIVVGDVKVFEQARKDRKSTRLNSSHLARSRMPSSA